jgi:hypothetical protein
VPGSDLSSRGAERTCAKAQETGATAMHCRRREHRKVRIRDCFLSCSFTTDAFRYMRTPLEAISRIHATSGTVLEIKNTKPCAALRVLAEKIGGSQENRNKWRDEARVAAVMGSCPRSKASHDSGMDFRLNPVGAFQCAPIGFRFRLLFHCCCRCTPLAEIHSDNLLQ